MEIPVKERPAPAQDAGLGGGIPEQHAREEHVAAQLRGLIDEVEALVDDGKTYLDAELVYQKTRMSFVTDRLQKAVVFGLAAAIVGLLAAIGLTVGLIIALTPLITGWGATFVVVGILLVAAFLLIKRAGRNWSSAVRATRSDNKSAGTSGIQGGS